MLRISLERNVVPSRRMIVFGCSSPWRWPARGSNVPESFNDADAAVPLPLDRAFSAAELILRRARCAPAVPSLLPLTRMRLGDASSCWLGARERTAIGSGWLPL